ncbi:MAG: glycosyltransferase family 2 protein [Candidatus Marsarchaeota archaeon]|nr:glycosyltransferase family 2 protein [Candidatus Marsarchaeota archaeon]
MSFPGFLLDLYAGISVLAFAALMAADAIGLFPRKEAAGRRGPYSPKTLVIVPCRGADHTLEQNLDSLRRQDYRNYRVIAVIDDSDDAALNVIKRLRIGYVISDSGCRNCSGKVRAISTALERFRGYDAYAIADSDILVERGWLAALVAPLQDRRIGLSTMYPYFRPVRGFWSKVKMVWGFVGDSLLERESSRFGWGGSLAFRADLMDSKAMDFFGNSRYSVSDDICLTKICKSKTLGIAYVPVPKPIVNCIEDFSSFSEWANRQTALTLLGYRRNLYVGLVYYTMEALVIVSGVLLSIFVSPLFLVFFMHYMRGAIINCRRAGAHYPEVALISFMLPFVYDINLVTASRMRHITWRGRRYMLPSA